MHSQPVSETEGDFRDWKPTVTDNPAYRCRKCGSPDVWYRIWDSHCGGFEDIRYHCRGCDRKWWVEGPDA